MSSSIREQVLLNQDKFEIKETQYFVLFYTDFLKLLSSSCWLLNSNIRNFLENYFNQFVRIHNNLDNNVVTSMSNFLILSNLFNIFVFVFSIL
jgi:hypothetical protein